MAHGGREEKREILLEFFGIGDAKFRDYLRKLCSFLHSLDDEERRFFQEHAQPVRIDKILHALSGKVTERDIEDFFAECPPVNCICAVGCCGRPFDDDDDDDLTAKASS